MNPVRYSSAWQQVCGGCARIGRLPSGPRRAISGIGLDPYFEATVDATEEAVIDALLAATTTTGVGGRTIDALPHDRVRTLLGLQ